MSMLRDFRDGNKDLITMFKDTDKTHIFKYTEDSGSVFIWNKYNVFCEGRLASANELPDFTFSVTQVTIDDEQRFMILFPAEKITSNLRESKLYWRVIAKDKITNLSKVINYGEILMKGI